MSTELKWLTTGLQVLKWYVNSPLNLKLVNAGVIIDFTELTYLTERDIWIQMMIPLRLNSLFEHPAIHSTAKIKSDTFAI